jgi:hypothetical protein
MAYLQAALWMALPEVWVRCFSTLAQVLARRGHPTSVGMEPSKED